MHNGGTGVRKGESFVQKEAVDCTEEASIYENSGGLVEV